MSDLSPDPQNKHADQTSGDDKIVSDRNARRLRQSGMLHPARTPVFDRVVDQARRIFGCQASMLTIIDEQNDRQFFKAESGLLADPDGPRQTSLAHSICRIVVRDSAPLVITDARTDPRVADNEAVTLLNIVAYLGVPIKDETGQAIAALCLIEQKPRPWTSANIEVLQAFAEGVSTQIRTMFQFDETRGAVPSPQPDPPFRIGKVAGAALTYVHDADSTDRIVHASAETHDIWDLSGPDYIDAFDDVFGLCLPEDYPLARASFGSSAGGMIPWHHKWRIRTAQGDVRWLEGHGLPEPGPEGSIAWNCIISDVTPSFG